jgi:hypothetical protein
MPCCCKPNRDSGQVFKVYFKCKENRREGYSDKKNTLASLGLFCYYQGRHNTHNIKTDGKTASANVNAGNVFPKMLATIQEYINCSR